MPADPTAEGSVAGIAAAAAAYLETFLVSRAPLVLAFSTGRTLRAVVGEVGAVQSPQHKIVSLVGTITRDGRASPYEIVMRLADRTGAQCYPMPLPVVASSAEECRLLQTQRSFATVRELAEQAAAAFVGVGHVAWNAPLHRDGFITDAEVGELIAQGAVGEIAGWAFDDRGSPIESSLGERVTGIPLARPARHLTIGVAGGRAKAAALRAAMQGRVLTGLITDERTASAILEMA